MPHIDGRTGEVVLRIVYDGAPVAGKTTNIEHLSGRIPLQRRSAIKSPGHIGPRTEFFDWLDFSGGYLDGRRVRCQLITVPGQSHLLHRRQYLLETADVIVFVADSRPETFVESARSVAATLRIVERFAQEIPVGIILQTNKQDLAGALTPGEVARALGIGNTTPVLGSVASSGAGVMETFVLAVRLATDRVRVLLIRESLKDLPEMLESPEALHTAMLEIDVATKAASQAGATRQEAVRKESETQEETLPEVVGVRIGADEQAAVTVTDGAGPNAEKKSVVSSEPAPAIPVVHAALKATGRRNLLSSKEDVSVPQAQDIGSGHIWPPVKGRSVLAVATSSKLAVPEEVLPWAPVGAMELVSESGWVLHSTDRWTFASEAEARLRLLTSVRRTLPRMETLPDTRSLLVAEEGKGWRLWLLTPHTLSLREHAVAALQERNMAALDLVFQQAISVMEKLMDAGIEDAEIRAGAGGVALDEGRLVLLTMEEEIGEPTLAASRPLAELCELLGQRTKEDKTLQGWVEKQGLQLQQRRAASVGSQGAS